MYVSNDLIGQNVLEKVSIKEEIEKMFGREIAISEFIKIQNWALRRISLKRRNESKVEHEEQDFTINTTSLEELRVAMLQVAQELKDEDSAKKDETK